MNKDLMMKAAIKYKGKWSEDSYDLIVATPSDITLGKRERDGSVTYVSKGVDENTFIRSWSHCTRDQFESFVESLFDGAPEDATHYLAPAGRTYPCWIKDLCTDDDFCRYRVIIEEVMHSYTDENWQAYNANKVLEGGVLIPRPAKKAPVIGDTPQQLKEGVQPKSPYMPKVGEECEYKYKAYRDTFNLGTVDFIGDKLIVITNASDYEQCYHTESLEFRPLRTERELFIEQATDDYLDQVGSDAVNAKWFERIFGAMYDAGYKKTRD